MIHLGVAIATLTQEAEALRVEGASVMVLAADGQLAGLLAVSDLIKASVPEAVLSSKAAGMRIIMATGEGLTTLRLRGRTA